MNITTWIFTWILLANATQQSVSLSPEISEEEILRYIKGIQELQNASNVNPVPNKPFDPLKYDENAAFENAQEYDFIIVGAGTAGSVIASRLSEIPSWKILLLEAGESETPYTQIPALFDAMVRSKYSWRYITEPQDTWCLGMVDRRCTSPTGKGVGGATIINGMVYSRGNARDYDLWANQGNSGWSYKEVLPYFKKAENCALEECDNKYHHQGGPLNIEEPQYVNPLDSAFISAGIEFGYSIVDYNGKEETGFSKTQALTKLGKRYSVAQSYLLPFRNRTNLLIKPLSHVFHVIIEPETKTAIGVKYAHNDRIYIAKASKEVILSAGPFNSAQLLMLSGVGPQEDLQTLKIPVIRNLQVGKYMKDHTAFLGLNYVLNISKFKEPDLHDQIRNWLKYGNGPLASVAATALAFIPTEVTQDPYDYPDVEIVLLKARFSRSLRIKKEYKYVLDPATNNETFRIEIRPTRPKSIGNMKLNSTNPYGMPVINPRQFSDPDGHDLETLLSAIKKVLQLITKSSAFKKLGAHPHSEPIKNCQHFTFSSDEYWRCAIRYFSRGARHQTGACRMGPPSDKYAIVDNQLRVYGMQQLRVADTSIIPVSITGHTQAPAIMIGEKAADLIKGSWS